MEFLYPLPYYLALCTPLHLVSICILYHILYNKSVNVFPWVLQAINIDEERLVETTDL